MRAVRAGVQHFSAAATLRLALREPALVNAVLRTTIPANNNLHNNASPLSVCDLQSPPVAKILQISVITQAQQQSNTASPITLQFGNTFVKCDCEH